MNSIKKYVFGLAMIAGLFLVGCTDEEGGTTPTETTPPTVSVNNLSIGNGSAVSPGDTITFMISATAGTNNITALRFRENGARLDDVSRLIIDGTTASSSDLIVPADEGDGFTRTVSYIAANAEGDYEVTVQVDGGSSGSVGTDDFSYTVSALESIEGVLFNAGGPQGTGGLDLDSAVSTGSSDADAEIRDLGINTNLPNDQNWIQKIAPANDAELVSMNSEFNFEGVITAQGVIDSYSEGTSISESDVITVGDVFGIKRGENYYLIFIKEVNVTSSDNNDNYVLDIKKAQ